MKGGGAHAGRGGDLSSRPELLLDLCRHPELQVSIPAHAKQRASYVDALAVVRSFYQHASLSREKRGEKRGLAGVF